MLTSGKGNQGLGKWEDAATMVRLVRELTQMLEDGVELEKGDQERIDNVVIPFLRSLPKKVQDDLLHG